MDSAKPIEPGCLAMLIRGHDRGKMCYVGNVIEDAPGALSFHKSEGRIWEIDREISWLHIQRKMTIKLAMAPERALMRIDDPDNQKQIEEEKQHEDKRLDRTERRATDPACILD